MTPWLIICALATVVDGDTIRCGHEGVRLRTINAPEMHEPGGREAKDRLAVLVDGKRVVCRIYAVDVYRRLVGVCGTDAVPSLDAAMVASGLAAPRRGR